MSKTAAKPSAWKSLLLRHETVLLLVVIIETSATLKKVKAPVKASGIKKDKMGNIIQPTADKKKAAKK